MDNESAVILRDMESTDRAPLVHGEHQRFEFSGTVRCISSENATPPAGSSRAASDAASQTAESQGRDVKVAVTLQMNSAQKKRAETAVLRTQGYSGGYMTLAALVDGAVERELERLAIEFNDGEPFPPNLGAFRVGRPLGS